MKVDFNTKFEDYPLNVPSAKRLEKKTKTTTAAKKATKTTKTTEKNTEDK